MKTNCDAERAKIHRHTEKRENCEKFAELIIFFASLCLSHTTDNIELGAKSLRRRHICAELTIPSWSGVLCVSRLVCVCACMGVCATALGKPLPHHVHRKTAHKRRHRPDCFVLSSSSESGPKAVRTCDWMRACARVSFACAHADAAVCFVDAAANIHSFDFNRCVVVCARAVYLLPDRTASNGGSPGVGIDCAQM